MNSYKIQELFLSSATPSSTSFVKSLFHIVQRLTPCVWDCCVMCVNPEVVNTAWPCRASSKNLALNLALNNFEKHFTDGAFNLEATGMLARTATNKARGLLKRDCRNVIVN